VSHSSAFIVDLVPPPTDGKIIKATKILFRVNQHFTGNGNDDIYADYRCRDKFTMKLLPLSTSGYNSLDKFEKDMIAKYDAYNNGYNKTHGNG